VANRYLLIVTKFRNDSYIFHGAGGKNDPPPPA